MALLLVSFTALAQTDADEHKDWGILPGTQLRRPPYSAPTPVSIPGAATLSTRDLRALIESEREPVLVDVASGQHHLTLPRAFWLPGAGHGANFIDGVQASLTALLAKITKGDKRRPVVFFCVNARCWLSYNAALRAVAAGYESVYWYRGGIESWRAAGLPLVVMQPAGEP